MNNSRKKQPGPKISSITFKTTPELKRIVETICYEERITTTYLIETLIMKYYRNRMKRNKEPEQEN